MPRGPQQPRPLHFPEVYAVTFLITTVAHFPIGQHHHQEAGDDSGRSKLSKAFSRWRLNTCDATVDELSGSLSALSRDGTVGREAEQFDFSEDAFSHPPRRVLSLQEMWETAAAAAGEFGDGNCDLHAIIMNQARADRPLPWELCEAYEREMVERIDRRQAENNVPLLPICLFASNHIYLEK